MKKPVQEKSADDEPVCICGYPRTGLPAIDTPCPEYGSIVAAAYKGSFSYYGWNAALQSRCGRSSFSHSSDHDFCAFGYSRRFVFCSLVVMHVVSGRPLSLFHGNEHVHARAKEAIFEKYHSGDCFGCGSAHLGICHFADHGILRLNVLLQFFRRNLFVTF